MAISTTYDEATRTLVLTVEQDFTFLVLSDFQSAYQSAPLADAYIVDFSQASFIDSSGLGMLLMLREHAGDGSADITLQGPNEEILRVLRIANFDKLFTIRP